METPGEYLKKTRERQGISLDEIAQVTKISIDLLEDIESDRYDSLSTQVITKGYLRAYAKELGLDAEEVVSRYQEHLNTLEEKEKRENDGSVKKKRPYGKHLLLFLLLLVFTFLIVYSNSDLNKRDEIPTPKPLKPEIQVPPKKIEVLIEDAAQNIEKGEISEQIVSEPETIENLTLKSEEKELVTELPEEDTLLSEKQVEINLVAKITELTWIKFRIDEGQNQEILLSPGETFSWKAKKRIKLLIGNAGGVDFTLGKEHLGFLGSSGKVLSITFPR